MRNESITVTIYRSTGAGPEQQSFEVPCEHQQSVLTVLNYIYENQDPTLGFRHYKCGHGVCNGCRININGEPRKACATVVSPGAHLVLKPCKGTLIRDLLTVLGGGPLRDSYGSVEP